MFEVKKEKPARKTEYLFEIGKYSRLGAFKITREKNLAGYINFQGAQVSVWDRKKFNIEGSRDRENPLQEV